MNQETIAKQADIAVIFEQYAQMGARTMICLLMTSENVEFIGSHMAITTDTYDIAESKKLSKADGLRKIETHIKSIVLYNAALKADKEAKDKNKK